MVQHEYYVSKIGDNVMDCCASIGCNHEVNHERKKETYNIEILKMNFGCIGMF